MQHHTLLIATLPQGDTIITVHQGNPDMPQGSIQHLELHFRTYGAADMVKRVITSDGVKEFIAHNFTVKESNATALPKEELVTIEESLPEIEEELVGKKRKKVKGKDSKE